MLLCWMLTRLNQQIWSLCTQPQYTTVYTCFAQPKTIFRIHLSKVCCRDVTPSSVHCSAISFKICGIVVTLECLGEVFGEIRFCLSEHLSLQRLGNTWVSSSIGYRWLVWQVLDDSVDRFEKSTEIWIQFLTLTNLSLSQYVWNRRTASTVFWSNSRSVTGKLFWYRPFWYDADYRVTSRTIYKCKPEETKIVII